jgi:EamA domain-containing membrane protein RarD
MAVPIKNIVIGLIFLKEKFERNKFLPPIHSIAKAKKVEGIIII